MEVRRLLPYIVGLLVLAFALGSLPRSSPGGSLLFGSYWLIYLIYLGPVALLGIMVALIILVGLNWRGIGSALGHGFAQSRKVRKRKSRRSLFISGLIWAVALGLLVSRYANGDNNQSNTNTTPKSLVVSIVGSNAPPPSPLPIGFVQTVSSLVQSNWFTIAFLGLLVVGGLVLFQAARASLEERSQLYSQNVLANQAKGLQAVNYAIKLVDSPETDPRTRIILCYQHLISTASRLGAPISSDLTARELERTIRVTFLLTGAATGQLTNLFEEARYSLHKIVEEDATRARGYLESIADELKIQLDAEP